jgi:hypothetical protein
MDDTDLNDILLAGRRTQPGVFAVEHKSSGKRLIVATMNLSKRLHDQWRYLRHGRHHNPTLEADLQRDGVAAFQTVLLAFVEDVKLLQPLKHLHVEEAVNAAGGCYNLVRPKAEDRPRVLLDQKLIGTEVKRLQEWLERHQRSCGQVQDQEDRVGELLDYVRQTVLQLQNR